MACLVQLDSPRSSEACLVQQETIAPQQAWRAVVNATSCVFEFVRVLPLSCPPTWNREPKGWHNLGDLS